MVRVRFKDGVVWALMDPRLEAALEEIAETWHASTGRVMTITSGRDSDHSSNSLHYEGRAFDVRTRGIEAVKQRSAVMALRELLGPNWDIVLEFDHVHVELDRRADN